MISSPSSYCPAHSSIFTPHDGQPRSPSAARTRPRSEATAAAAAASWIGGFIRRAAIPPTLGIAERALLDARPLLKPTRSRSGRRAVRPQAASAIRRWIAQPPRRILDPALLQHRERHVLVVDVLERRMAARFLPTTHRSQDPFTKIR
ncbi:MAG: hypothetical protein U0610_20385 [bacterium]